METTNRRLTRPERDYLRNAIDQAVRARTLPPANRACPECGADTADLPAPVHGCTTCANRYWRRRSRSQR